MMFPPSSVSARIALFIGFLLSHSGSVCPHQTVLVTGVNGFVGSHVAKAFLESGWSVVGTVRSTEKGKDLLAQPAFFEAAKNNRMSCTVIKDISQDDFHSALQGVDAIAHTASPCHFDGTSHEEYAIPAIGGTSNILNAAKDFPKIKAIAITSFFAAVIDFDDKGFKKSYTKDDWLTYSVDNVKDLSNAHLWYCDSKKLAEQKAWEIYKTQKNWSLATFCPPSIFGPIIHTQNLDQLGLTPGRLYKLMSGQTEGKVETSYSAWTDVRDLAEAHVQAIVKKTSGRFLINSGLYDSQRFVDLIHDRFPTYATERNTPIGKPKHYILPENGLKLDCEDLKKTLGIKLKTFDETFVETAECYMKMEQDATSKKPLGSVYRHTKN